ncbi:hypothetical protein [Actinokineospora globicatena]|uniref:hypothetical protein n=1 Tax=Actinokineospora globicatena TaxID=103729 RepID=UPI0020A308CC|nr:hypothetical protein [Actinokineospora globicatena]MCP2302224.1 hypothetical protein [Actinokineospora globicatena]GLW76112.1 hypothetical protein Aglo01_05940 [Actinokineospora globicatena]GLW82947.1 hypothetical protein Aglo02_05870 [Actinokineospora globicatena]
MDSADQLTDLISPVPVAHLTAVLARWLWDGHRAAAELQELRRDDERGVWANPVSYGTDRYQYLVTTAASLCTEVDDLQPDRGFQSLLLKLPRAALYPLSAPQGPDGPLGMASDLRRELLGEGERQELALLSRRELWVEGRDLVLLPWQGNEDAGLVGLWAGKGVRQRGEGSRVDWEWLVELDLTGGNGQAALFPTGPRRPRPRAHRDFA